MLSEDLSHLQSIFRDHKRRVMLSPKEAEALFSALGRCVEDARAMECQVVPFSARLAVPGDLGPGVISLDIAERLVSGLNPFKLGES
jgi:hypothetical protein